MRPLASIPAAGLLLACACSSPGRTHAAAPDPGARAAVASASAGDAPIRLPERIVLPASYRLVLLDGHLALVREAD